MREVPVFAVSVSEARAKLTALISEVESGADIVITRRGLPVARLVRAAPGHSPARAASAAEGLRRLGAELTLGGVTIAGLVRDGGR